MVSRRLMWFFSQILIISAFLAGTVTLPSAAIFPHSSILAEVPSWEGGGTAPSNADAVTNDASSDKEVDEEAEKVEEEIEKLSLKGKVADAGLKPEASDAVEEGITKVSQSDASGVSAGRQKFLPRDINELRQITSQADKSGAAFNPNTYCNDYNCQGYADSLNRVAQNAGGNSYINQRQVMGEMLVQTKWGPQWYPHTWNYVEFQDGWHHVDPNGMQIVDNQIGSTYRNVQITRDASGQISNILPASNMYRMPLNTWEVSGNVLSRTSAVSKATSQVGSFSNSGLLGNSGSLSTGLSSSSQGINSTVASLGGSSGVCTSGGCSGGGGGGGLSGILGGLGGGSGLGGGGSGGGLGSVLSGGGLGGGGGLGALAGAGKGGLGGLAVVGGSLLGSKLQQNQNQNTQSNSSQQGNSATATAKTENLAAGLTAEERKTINALCQGKATGCRAKLIQRLNSVGSLSEEGETDNRQGDSLDSF